MGRQVLMEKPRAERIAVPTDRLGARYAGQWVERRLEPDDLFDRYVALTLGKPGFRTGDFVAMLKGHVDLASLIFTNWNLKTDEGPLPKPWMDPGPFLTLWILDPQVFFWLLDLSADFALRVTANRRLDRLLLEALESGEVGYG
jgi:hypothetical protein